MMDHGQTSRPKGDDAMIFSRRSLVNIVVPLMVSQVLSVAIGMEDSIMVSAAGEAAISGVGLVDSINQLLVYLFTSLSAGGSVVIAQLLGNGSQKRANVAVGQLLLTVVSVAVLMSLAAVALRAPLLRFLFGSIEADVMASASSYFLYTALAYPFLGLFSSCEACFSAMGNPRVSMLASVLMNVVNIAANALFINGLHMGVAGAALGTLLARACSGFLLLYLLHDRKNTLYVAELWKIRPNGNLIRSICRIGIPNGLENSMFQLGRVLTQSLIATFGTAQIAANAAALSITALQYIPGSAIGTAMIIIVGRCVGAQEKEQAKKYTLRLLAIAYGAILVLSAAIVLLRSPIVATYHLTGDSFDLAVHLLLYHTVCVCTIWPLAFTLPNSFRAASDVKFTMTLSIFSMWAFRIGLSYFFSDQFHWGIMSVWYAMAVDWGFRAIVFTVHYFRGKWLTKYHGI